MRLWGFVSMKGMDSLICYIIDDDLGKRGKYIHGIKVVGDRNQILKYAQKYTMNEIIIALPSVSRQEQMKIAVNNPQKLIIFDIYENNVYDIQQELKQKYSGFLKWNF